jgi:hypothetical protein
MMNLHASHTLGSSRGNVLDIGVGYVLIRTFKSLVCARIFKYEVYRYWVDTSCNNIEVSGMY